MTRNVGGVDRFLRVIIGAILISLVYVGPKSLFGWLGLIPLISGLVGNCPAYTLFGWNTCRSKRD